MQPLAEDRQQKAEIFAARYAAEQYDFAFGSDRLGQRFGCSAKRVAVAAVFHVDGHTAETTKLRNPDRCITGQQADGRGDDRSTHTMLRRLGKGARISYFAAKIQRAEKG